MILIYVTCQDEEQAEKIGRYLLERRLAACINILSGVASIYWWKGKLEESREAILLVKTKDENFTVIEKEIKKLHTDTTPGIFSIKVNKVHKPYLKWLEEEIK